MLKPQSPMTLIAAASAPGASRTTNIRINLFSRLPSGSAPAREKTAKRVVFSSLTLMRRSSTSSPQSAAVSAALSAFDRELLGNHIRTCVAEDLRAGDDTVVDELMATLQKLMR